MDKVIINKNKNEVFKCRFKIDGASMDDAVVRLCLEFDNNKNMFFYGKLDEDGECIVEIPKLKELESNEGTLTIEAIVDSVYFKLYESPVEMKNPVEVKLLQTPKIQPTKNEKVVKLEQIERESVKLNKIDPIIEEVEEPEPKVINPYIPHKLKPKVNESLLKNPFEKD